MNAQATQSSLLDAYRAALYEVDGQTRFVLRVDRVSEPLRELCQAHGVSSAAYLTAFNPGSQRVSDATNRLAQQRLVACIEADGWPVVSGRSLAPDGGWPPEDSILVLGIPQHQALDMGRRFEQAAILWSDKDAVPRLLEC